MVVEKRIAPAFRKSKPNRNTPLYRGPGNLIQSRNHEDIPCTIYMRWFPNTGLYVSGSIQKSYVLGDAVLKTRDQEYRINIVTLRLGTDGKNTFEAAVDADSHELVPDKKIYFALVNFKEYIGMPVYNDKEMRSWSRDRISVLNDDYSLKIDKRKDFRVVQTTLKSHGGYGITHYGVIAIKKESSTPANMIVALQYVLSFINGAWCGPVLLAQQIHRRKIVRYRNSFLSDYRYRRSVLGKLQWAEMQEVIELMCPKLMDDKCRQTYMTLVHTYIVCSDVSKITVEMATVLIQTALEMIAEIAVYERTGTFTQREWKNKSACSKISILLGEFGVPIEIPETMRALRDSLAAKRLTGPEIITKIRNPHVHPDRKNRRKIEAYTAAIRIEIWRLAMWYYDLCMLKLIGYNGKYSVAISGERTEVLESVPWR
jgi:hypothetical protein